MKFNELLGGAMGEEFLEAGDEVIRAVIGGFEEEEEKGFAVDLVGAALFAAFAGAAIGVVAENFLVVEGVADVLVGAANGGGDLFGGKPLLAGRQ